MKIQLAILFLTGSSLLGGELPELFEKPWTAWYSGYEGRFFHFGVNPDGEASLIPMKTRKERSNERVWIRIRPVIEEVRPDGKVVTKKNLEDGWEAVSEESPEAEVVHFRGTVTGGAKYEVFFEVDGSELRGGGRILDKGELTEHPIRLSMRIMIPDLYRHDVDAEVIEKKSKRDRVDFLMADGKKKRFDIVDEIDAYDENGKGVRTARVEVDPWDGARMDLDAGEAGLFEFSNRGKRPLYKGFTLAWKPDPAKNPDGKARFVLKFK